MYNDQGSQVPLDILPAKLIKIIKKRKEIKNNSSKMITKSTFLRTQNIKPVYLYLKRHQWARKLIDASTYLPFYFFTLLPFYL